VLEAPGPVCYQKGGVFAISNRSQQSQFSSSNVKVASWPSFDGCVEAEVRGDDSGNLGASCGGCALGGHGSIILAMQEVLSKTDNPESPLHDQEFYELRLYDSESAGEPVYCVREACTRWIDLIKGVEWNEPEIGTFATHEEAKEWYATRRQALAEKGFIYSDMDLF
jgi:hypothetical protein